MDGISNIAGGETQRVEGDLISELGSGDDLIQTTVNQQDSLAL